MTKKRHKRLVRRLVNAFVEDWPDDYFDPAQPIVHRIAAREASISEQPLLLGRPEYAITKDGYKYTLIVNNTRREPAR